MRTWKVIRDVVLIGCGLSCSFVLHGQEAGSEDLRIRSMTYYLSGTFPTFTVRFKSEQFVNRILLQESANLETWADLELPDSFRTIDGSTLFWEWTAFGRYFYRGILVLPEIKTIFQDIELASGTLSSEIPFVIDDPAYLEFFLNVTATSSNQLTVPDSNIVLTGSDANWTITVQPTEQGTDPAEITITVTAPDGLSDNARFTVTSIGGTGYALIPEDFRDRVVGYQFPGVGYVFLSETKFNWNGEPGNWTYERTGAHTGLLLFTYDEDNNNPDVYREVYNLNFETSHSGSYDYTEVTDGTVASSSSGVFDLDQFILATAGIALTPSEFADKVVGNFFIDPAYKFDSATRFTFTGDAVEKGNWTYQKTSETTATMVLTYDEDGNNPAIYREVVMLTYETENSGTYTYREYYLGGLLSSAEANFTL